MKLKIAENYYVIPRNDTEKSKKIGEIVKK